MLEGYLRQYRLQTLDHPASNRAQPNRAGFWTRSWILLPAPRCWASGKRRQRCTTPPGHTRRSPKWSPNCGAASTGLAWPSWQVGCCLRMVHMHTHPAAANTPLSLTHPPPRAGRPETLLREQDGALQAQRGGGLRGAPQGRHVLLLPRRPGRRLLGLLPPGMLRCLGQKRWAAQSLEAESLLRRIRQPRCRKIGSLSSAPPIIQVHDIEDLRNFARGQRACPYFLASKWSKVRVLRGGVNSRARAGPHAPHGVSLSSRRRPISSSAPTPTSWTPSSEGRWTLVRREGCDGCVQQCIVRKKVHSLCVCLHNASV